MTKATSTSEFRFRIRAHHALRVISGRPEKSYISQPFFPIRPYSAMDTPPQSRQFSIGRSATRSSISSESSSTSSSAASITSFASTMTESEVESGKYDLQQRARIIMGRLSDLESSSSPEVLENDEVLMDLIDEDVKIQHDDLPVVSSRAAMLDMWSRVRALKYEMRIKEAAVDETQRKVWVVSELVKQGEGSDATTVMVKERVDMMTFDLEGRLCGTIDYYRRRRRSTDDEQEE